MKQIQIEIIATQINPHEVIVQTFARDGEESRYCGIITMRLNQYRAYVNTLLTGSGASGDEGAEIKLTEKDFEKWRKE